MRVPRDVRERLLRDPEDGHLDRGRKRRHRVGREHLAGDLPLAAGGERRRLLADRLDEPELVERRAGAARRRAGGCRRPWVSRLAATRSSSSSTAAGSRVSHAARGLDHQDRARERRPETVVEVAAEPPPLLLARGDEPLARALDLGSRARSRSRLPQHAGRNPRAGGGRPRRAPRRGRERRSRASPPRSPPCTSGSRSATPAAGVPWTAASPAGGAASSTAT